MKQNHVRKIIFYAIASAFLGNQFVAGFALAGENKLSDYTVEDLLAPCMEADNDSRWGAPAETECEQYIRGFIDGLIISGTNGDFCFPDLNRDDEARWVFMKWSMQNYGQRGMPAAEGLLESLRIAFPCN